jgi:RimJ/RimL family protein N-acetyltransferase
MQEIRTKRLLLRPFRESDYDDLFEFLSRPEDDEFEGHADLVYSCILSAN